MLALRGVPLLGLACLLLTSGCGSLVSSTTGRLADNLVAALLDQNDPETVRQGAPAYLLLVDGLIEGDPENPALLLTGAKLYAAYTSAFVEDSERARVLSEKAKQYGLDGLCRSDRRTCGMADSPYPEFETAVNALGEKSLPALYGAASAWATWVQTNRDDWVAVADKARVQAMMERVVALDDSYRQGTAHLYLGVLATLLPEALGGKPEEGRLHFERAIHISGGRDLLAKVLLARDYGRLVFDRELHDRLCREVLSAKPSQPGLTLNNTLAIAEARRLLDSSEEYFGE